MNRKRWLLFSIIGILIVSAVFEVLFYLRAIPLASSTAGIASSLALVMLVCWVVVDSLDHRQIVRPFDYGFLVCTFFLPYFPYYLWRTRGAAGLLMCVGFVLLFFLGSLVSLGIYSIHGS